MKKGLVEAAAAFSRMQAQACITAMIEGVRPNTPYTDMVVTDITIRDNVALMESIAVADLVVERLVGRLTLQRLEEGRWVNVKSVKKERVGKNIIMRAAVDVLEGYEYRVKSDYTMFNDDRKESTTCYSKVVYYE